MILLYRERTALWRLHITMTPSIYCMHTSSLYSYKDRVFKQHFLVVSSGGAANEQQLVEYDITNGLFVDYGEDYLSSTLGNSDGDYGSGTFTQFNATTLYSISPDGESINVYHLPTISYQKLGTQIPTFVDNEACISSSQSPLPRLYITGGYDNDNLPYTKLDRLQILELDDLQWLPSTPTMSVTRQLHGCIVVNDRLWAIGGFQEDSFESMNIINITETTWNNIGNLSCELYNFGVIAVDDLIFIIGGYCSITHSSILLSSQFVTDTVFTIDTDTDTISVYADNLPYGVRGMSVIMVDYMIYGFGGLAGEAGYQLYSWTDKWMALGMLRVLAIVLCFHCCVECDV